MNESYRTLGKGTKKHKNVITMHFYTGALQNMMFHKYQF